MIRIMTDSTSDVPETMLKEYDISVIPQYLIWGQEQFIDRVTISPEAFYERLDRDPVRPTSSQPPLKDFVSAYERVAAEGADEIIMLTVSSAMSGTYNMAVNAAEMVKIPVRVVDSRGPTMMLGWQVLAAARAAKAGANLEKILAEIQRVQDRVAIIVGMQSLAPLAKGGRIGTAIRWMSNTIPVKPLVYVDKENGKVAPISLLRTQKSLMDALYSKFIEHVKDTRELHVAVLHGNAPESAQILVDRIRTELNPNELLTLITGPVLGLHTGSGALSICGYSDAI